MEYGPRALGSRSILANPHKRYMKDKVNKIKVRELFRPFAGAILQEHIHEFFDVPEKNLWSPFMLFCFVVKKDKKETDKRKTSLDIEYRPPEKQYSNERSKEKQEENDQIRRKFILGTLKGQQSMDDIDIEVIKNIRRR